MPRFSQLFAPKERQFFDLFEEASANLLLAAEMFEQTLLKWPEHEDLPREILKLEQNGDRITHEIVQRLNQTFVTPIEREDIYALAGGLDDILDFIEEVADFLSVYRIDRPLDQAKQMAQTLLQSCQQLAEAIPLLRSLGDIKQYTVEINRLENEGDRILREALAALFDNQTDPMLVIRWKDIFERLEDAIDACEKVANILEGIVIKNS
jgi:predicted phosphate transport protein (TIGR00153 family)